VVGCEWRFLMGSSGERFERVCPERFWGGFFSGGVFWVVGFGWGSSRRWYCVGGVMREVFAEG
jgi:hypothetical protein